VYHFPVNGTKVQCDSTKELFAAIGRNGNRVQDDSTTTTVTKKKRKKRRKNGGSSNAWALAKFYQESHPRMEINAIRTKLAGNPTLKAKTQEEMLAAQAAA